MTDGKPDENPKDRLAVLLASGYSLNRAAKECKIPYTNARRLSLKPEFRKKVSAISAEFVQVGVKAYGRLLYKAAARLGKLMDSTNDETALKAARGVVADYVALSEHVNVSSRVDEVLER